MDQFGPYKAKVSLRVLERVQEGEPGILVNVSAMTPTRAGEGKTCIAIGLTQALGRLGKKVALCLREPSLGPVFGLKGGGTGGGKSQLVPMDEINLHFTGDMHAVGAAHNLLAALVDNHIYHGNQMNLDSQTIAWRRVVDVSDRQLRKIVVGLGGRANGFPRESGFDITAASEIMAILALSTSMADLKERLGRILLGYTREKKPVWVRDLKAAGAMALLLKDALRPNLVQTSEGQPAFVHAGPFANIAHGNNSVLATGMALKLADYCVTESGFGSDLGSEKFFHIVCRQAGFHPALVVLVASLRALKIHGGVSGLKEAALPNLPALQCGLANLKRHLRIVSLFGLPVVVAINRFKGDDEQELLFLKGWCEEQGVPAEVADSYHGGGVGTLPLARRALAALEQSQGSSLRFLYDLKMPIREKIALLATQVYGARGVSWTGSSLQDMEKLTKEGFGDLPICMARTQLSFTHDPAVQGAPEGWDLVVREVRVSSGAGFLVVLTGEMTLMPGLPREPAAHQMEIDDEGNITGLF